VIRWTDFVLDDFLGPLIAFGGEPAVVRGKRTGASGAVKEDGGTSAIQETRRDAQPARMVGLSSHQGAGAEGMEAAPVASVELRGEGGA